MREVSGVKLARKGERKQENKGKKGEMIEEAALMDKKKNRQR